MRYALEGLKDALAAATVTRAVAALEDTLGVKLLDRTTRFVRATEARRRYLEDARQILAGLEAADDAAGDETENRAGGNGRGGFGELAAGRSFLHDDG